MSFGFNQNLLSFHYCLQSIQKESHFACHLQKKSINLIKVDAFLMLFNIIIWYFFLRL